VLWENKGEFRSGHAAKAGTLVAGEGNVVCTLLSPADSLLSIDIHICNSRCC
jgi:hypothetical protein